MRHIQWYQHCLWLENRVPEYALCSLWVAPNVEFGVRRTIAYPCLYFPSSIRKRGPKRGISEFATYSTTHNA